MSDVVLSGFSLERLIQSRRGLAYGVAITEDA
jgi:hypothetical protein